MILVDSSVWIDYFRGVENPQTAEFDRRLVLEPLATGDLILTEVLQGFANPAEFRRALQLLTSVDVVPLAGKELAIQAARNHLQLRRIGITVRKTIDTLIATWCIENGVALLHKDRDFEPFVTHLGLRSVV